MFCDICDKDLGNLNIYINYIFKDIFYTNYISIRQWENQSMQRIKQIFMRGE
jgi:hypothetical protein